MLDGYLAMGMAKWYVQYTVHEKDARAEMEGANFSIFVACSVAQDDACMCQRNCLGKQAAENASSSGGSVGRITAHMRQTRYLGTYLPE